MPKGAKTLRKALLAVKKLLDRDAGSPELRVPEMYINREKVWECE